jgi:hypothetical protein
MTRGTAKAPTKTPITTDHRAGEPPNAINKPDERPAAAQNKVMPSDGRKNIPV